MGLLDTIKAKLKGGSWCSPQETFFWWPCRQKRLAFLHCQNAFSTVCSATIILIVYIILHAGKSAVQKGLDSGKTAAGKAIDTGASKLGVDAVSERKVIMSRYSKQEWDTTPDDQCVNTKSLFTSFLQDKAAKAKTVAGEQIDKVKAELA